MGAYCLKKDSTDERFAEKVLYLPKMRNTNNYSINYGN